MKKAILTLTSLAILVGSTQANAVSLFLENSSPRCNGIDCIECAPEVIHGNMSATDKALTQLANGELSSASVFKEKILAARALKEADRMNTYLNLVGIQKDSEIIDFISAREIDQKYVNSLKANAALDDVQARLVIEKISASLLGQKK